MKILIDNKIVLIDDEDFIKIKEIPAGKGKWRIQHRNNLVLCRGKNGKTTYIHRVIMNCTSYAFDVDHINGNSLDNRKENLRICSHRQNCCNKKIGSNNTSGYKGVHKHINGKWRARVYVKNKPINVGCYINIIDAAKAYNEAATKYFGKFANLNIIPT